MFTALAPVVTIDEICQTPSIDGDFVCANTTPGASRTRVTRRRKRIRTSSLSLGDGLVGQENERRVSYPTEDLGKRGFMFPKIEEPWSRSTRNSSNASAERSVVGQIIQIRVPPVGGSDSNGGT